MLYPRFSYQKSIACAKSRRMELSHRPLATAAKGTCLDYFHKRFFGIISFNTLSSCFYSLLVSDHRLKRYIRDQMGVVSRQKAIFFRRPDFVFPLQNIFLAETMSILAIEQQICNINKSRPLRQYACAGGITIDYFKRSL